MMKAFEKIKHYWKIELVVVVGIPAVVVGLYLYIKYIGWIWDTWGQNFALSQISLFIAIVSLFIAIFVAIVAVRSLKLTRDSLELTRAATRPFLTVTSIAYQPPKTVEIIICNTGALPPDSNAFQATLSQTKDLSGSNESTGFRAVETHESPPIFPGEKQQWDLLFSQDTAEYINSGNELYIKIDIKYVYNGKEGITSRVSYLPKSDKQRRRVTFSILSEGSSWK